MGGSWQTWDLWIPDAAAAGVPFARGRLDPTDTLIVHSAPHLLTIEVRDGDGRLIAAGKDLERTEQVPMTRLHMMDGQVRREEFWPTEADIGTPVLLPGGEVGLITAWWNREDKREWRWSVEFYNSLG